MATRRQGAVRQRHAASCATREDKRCNCRGSWAIRFRAPDGRQVERSGYATAKAAESALRTALGEVDSGTFRQVRPVPFDEWARQWLQDHGPRVRPSTRASYTLQVNAHLVPYFGATPLPAIRHEHVARFVAQKLAAVVPDTRPGAEPGATRRAWSPKSVNHMLGVLRLILRAAVDAGRLTADPSAKVKPARLDPPHRDLLDRQELDRVTAAAGDPWALIIRVAAWTGLRRGELLALQWGDLELGDRPRVHVRRTTGRYGTGSPKSRAGVRPVPLASAVARDLRAHRMASPRKGPGDLVFQSATGTPIDPDNLGRAWERALRRAGIRHMRFHDLRRTAVSLMVAAGASPKAVQAIAGHATIGMTFDVYGDLLPDALDEVADRLDALAQEDPGQAASEAAQVGTPATRGHFVGTAGAEAAAG